MGVRMTWLLLLLLMVGGCSSLPRLSTDRITYSPQEEERLMARCSPRPYRNRGVLWHGYFFPRRGAARDMVTAPTDYDHLVIGCHPSYTAPEPGCTFVP